MTTRLDVRGTERGGRAARCSVRASPDAQRGGGRPNEGPSAPTVRKAESNASARRRARFDYRIQELEKPTHRVSLAHLDPSDWVWRHPNEPRWCTLLTNLTAREAGYAKRLAAQFEKELDENPEPYVIDGGPKMHTLELIHPQINYRFKSASSGRTEKGKIRWPGPDLLFAKCRCEGPMKTFLMRQSYIKGIAEYNGEGSAERLSSLRKAFVYAREGGSTLSWERFLDGADEEGKKVTTFATLLRQAQQADYLELEDPDEIGRTEFVQTVDFLYKNFAHLMGKNLFDVRVNAPEVFGTDTGSM